MSKGRRGFLEKYATCPYFHVLYETEIVCIGEEGARYSVRRANKQTEAFFHAACCKDWQSCPLARGLNEIYENEAEI